MTTDKRLILIHGLKESGKSTIADRLVEEYGYVRIKFADTLKNMLRTLLRDAGLDEETIERCIEGDMKNVPIKELCGQHSRHAMQTIGTEWRNMIHPNLWVNIAADRVERLLNEDHNVVVDDLRFPHEVEVMARFDPVMWMVPRNRRKTAGPSMAEQDAARLSLKTALDYLRPLIGIVKKPHPSERMLPEHLFHQVIRNDGDSKKELHDLIDSFMEGPAPGMRAA